MQIIMYKSVKRIIDILIALAALILFSPFALMLSLLIAIEDKGSPIYHHPRVGKNGKLFRFYKFRSMVKNADALLFSNPEFLKKLRSENHKLKDDPRITKTGKFIRKYSIDEFPQFLNVLNGDMSFVGPRPFRPDELEKYATERPDIKWKLDKILTAKPGITGLWQTSGRSELTFDQRIDLEVKYAESCSFLLDLYIIVKTPFAVIKAKGAF